MLINNALTIQSLTSKLNHFWEISGKKIKVIEREYDIRKGSPVFTANGKYTTKGWTEWTQGFQYGSAILQFDATGEEEFLTAARQATIEKMASHVANFGVHDHGFNNVSTYGNLLRLMKEGKIPYNEWEKHFYELALKLSGAVQAKRWTNIKNGGFIYSFNGPHSLFVDTIRTVRALVLSHELDFAIWGENDVKTNLLHRAIQHCVATAQYSIYYGEGRDYYDVRGRTAHESIFNTNDGNFRCPNTQQGYSGFSTWTRGLAWAITGFAEELEYLKTLENSSLADFGGFKAVEAIYLKAAKATCDFYIENTATDGIPYWDTGAPKLHLLGDYLNQPADPYNPHEPVDSSAAAIAAQGLLRLGFYLQDSDSAASQKYLQAGLTVLNTLFDTPYLSTDERHHGLILHAIYHQPNGWDYVPENHTVAHGESCMWGDYHARELALYVQRLLENSTYYTFFSAVK
jgi:rhamnogalacturonyl hydrolase YesR